MLSLNSPRTITWAWQQLFRGLRIKNMNSFICIEVGGYCQGYGYHMPNISGLNLGRTHHIPCFIRKQPSDIGGVPHKEGWIEFYKETTRTTRIVSILVSLVLLGQWDTYGYKYREIWNHAIIILQNLRYAILTHMSLTHVGPACHWDTDGISQTL